jgi:hypothetical protein
MVICAATGWKKPHRRRLLSIRGFTSLKERNGIQMPRGRLLIAGLVLRGTFVLFPTFQVVNTCANYDICR